jgi:hypothetical protein
LERSPIVCRHASIYSRHNSSVLALPDPATFTSWNIVGRTRTFCPSSGTVRKYADWVWRKEVKNEKERVDLIHSRHLDKMVQLHLRNKAIWERDGEDAFGEKLSPTVIFRSSEGVFRKYTDGKWKREVPDLGIYFQRNR